MKKPTITLIAFVLCTFFIPTAHAWHTEYFTRADGMEDCRIVLDEWDKEPLSFTLDMETEEKEEEKQIKPVDELTIENEGPDTIITDRINLRKWRSVHGVVEETCRRIPY